MKTLTGNIVSLANKNTALVEVINRFKHPLYQKYLRRSKKYACHVDSGLELALGDTVTIVPCRPMSKTKTYRVVVPQTKGK